mgnify:FL=1
MKKEYLFEKLKRNTHVHCDMPDMDIAGIVYADPLAQFCEMAVAVGGKIAMLGEGENVNEAIKRLYPDAKVFASNLHEISIATRNPDTVCEAQDLNGTDVGILQGELGVAENACVWVPQTMKEKAVMFISEELVLLLDRKKIVNNMHEAYANIAMTDYGYGCFISGPSKTADIEQALVMGAQAARGVTVLLT